MDRMLIFISIMKDFFFYIFQFTLFSITAVAVAQNKALDFDGSDDQISISFSSSLDVSDQVTIEAWVKHLAQTEISG